eukprot:CAMPEP_0198139792 /NCGR_PEP_ID=MMETSP1443-20131203/3030_1 /TAXON_ID=186043 /ORGANISM="Entomoneis sp., Strain CCMP2396" /LENGTH=80 /DNA_ID=CAMNT_0043802015 /DNA_START=353 /DNA_END=595 /DNA_ORIENTATION=-
MTDKIFKSTIDIRAKRWRDEGYIVFYFLEDFRRTRVESKTRLSSKQGAHAISNPHDHDVIIIALRNDPGLSRTPLKALQV